MCAHVASGHTAGRCDAENVKVVNIMAAKVDIGAASAWVKYSTAFAKARPFYERWQATLLCSGMSYAEYCR